MKFVSQNNEGVITEDGVVITFEDYKSGKFEDKPRKKKASKEVEEAEFEVLEDK